MTGKSVLMSLAFCSFAVWAGEAWDHWEFGSEVSGVWTPGVTGDKGFGELRDGNWRLVAGLESNGTGRANCLTIRSLSGGWPSATGTHNVVLDGTGEMDLSKPVSGANGGRMYIVGIMGTAFHYWDGANSNSNGRKLETFIAPHELESISIKMLCGESKYQTLTNVVLVVPQCTKIEEQPVSGTKLSGMTIYAPRCTTIANRFLAMANKDYRLDFSSQGFSLDAVETMDAFSMSDQYDSAGMNDGQCLSGVFRLPSLKTLACDQFQRTTFGGLILGSDDPQIAQLEKIGLGINEDKPSDIGKWNTLSVFGFQGCLNLPYLVIGEGSANMEIGRLAFDRTAGLTDGGWNKLPQRIYFTGAKPRIGFGAFYVRNQGSTPKSSVFVIRKGQTGWETIVAAAQANSTATDANNFDKAFANKGLTYIGVMPIDPVYDGIDVEDAIANTVPKTESVHFGCSAPQYLAYGSFRTENNDIEVRNVMPDGSYLRANALLGFWTEKDLALNEVRTVKVPAKVLANDGNTYSCEGYTLETATSEGWTTPTDLVTGTSYTHTQTAKGSVRVSFKWSLSAKPLASGLTWKVADEAWNATSGDALIVTATPAADEFGNYPTNALITLTPTFTAWKESDGLPKWGFARWEGHTEDCTIDEQTGALTLPSTASARTLVARFRHDWLYDATTKTIWNRVFRLNVERNNNWLNVLRICDWSGNGNAWIKDKTLNADGLPTALHEMANRPLDLDEPVTDATGASWTIVRMTARSLAPWSSYTISRSGSVNDPRLANFPSQIVLPSTLTQGDDYIVSNGKSDVYPLTSVIMNCPNLEGKLGRQLFAWNQLISEVVLKLPKVTEMADGVFIGSDKYGRLSKTDLSLWDLSSLTTTHVQAFDMGASVGQMTGVLKLPKMTSVTNELFCDFCGMTGIELGGKKPSVVSIGEGAFSNCTALASVRISNKPTLTVGANAFCGTTALKDIRFNGLVPSTATVDAFLQERKASTPSDYAVIRGYGSNGWRAAAAPLDAGQGEVAPTGEILFGVWRAGLRKAYIVDWPDAPWMEKGFSVFVR